MRNRERASQDAVKKDDLQSRVQHMQLKYLRTRPSSQLVHARCPLPPRSLAAAAGRGMYEHATVCR